jgi:hypothetical protein
MGEQLGANVGLQHLPNPRSRQIIPDLNLLRGFDAADLLLHEGHDRRGVDLRSWSRLQDDNDAFPPFPCAFGLVHHRADRLRLAFMGKFFNEVGKASSAVIAVDVRHSHRKIGRTDS